MNKHIPAMPAKQLDITPVDGAEIPLFLVQHDGLTLGYVREHQLRAALGEDIFAGGRVPGMEIAQAAARIRQREDQSCC